MFLEDAANKTFTRANTATRVSLVFLLMVSTLTSAFAKVAQLPRAGEAS